MSALLDLAYQSQLEPGALWASNDCGVACAWQVTRWHRDQQQRPLRDTVDRMAQYLASRRWGYNLTDKAQVLKAKKRFCTIGDLVWLLNQYAVPARSSDASVSHLRLNLDKLRLELDQGRPVITLVLYELLTTRHFTNFGGGHYVVVVGHDGDTFYLNDPYYPGQLGKSVAVPAAELQAALRPGKSNPYFSLPSGVYVGT